MCDARAKAIETCIDTDPVFKWKWRVVQAASRTIYNCNMYMNPDMVKKAKSLARRIKHLEAYCEEQVAEQLEFMAEVSDPYGYRGLRHSDF